ncbi:hypothetical protein CY34DRAFT_804511 [Suillus luteus UH-Slu-Lm8-n1]|uniref:Uncharacterized protein n=1 Tax=Suillus luteus UH-Slu-Lm8-n1 TaxID=930992 RepID=A0A0D0AYI9_9AGAM|nr:hypothetical protein CY34DRAFT_804511 [Suillus luteus UH-Slu-Lm8-n1]
MHPHPHWRHQMFHSRFHQSPGREWFHRGPKSQNVAVGFQAVDCCKNNNRMREKSDLNLTHVFRVTVGFRLEGDAFLTIAESRVQPGDSSSAIELTVIEKS